MTQHGRRKLEHLQVCLEKDVQSGLSTGLERYQLRHQALPEIALDDVDTRTSFLGRDLRAPLLISSMTGGTALGATVNRHLASAAQELGLALALGSQRAGIEDPGAMDTYQVRAEAPDILLLANLGAVQLNYGYGVGECARAVEAVGADGLILHLNPLQEALQRGGNSNFRGLLQKIGAVCRELAVPVIVKEVGWGIGPSAVEALREAGVAAVEVAGAGGTSWSEVERQRGALATGAEVAEVFRDWGLPTAEAVVAARRECPDLPLVASGGITQGVQVATALALGANLAGLARVLLRPAVESAAAVVAKVNIIIAQLRVAMFCTGARTTAQLDRSCVAASRGWDDGR